MSFAQRSSARGLRLELHCADLGEPAFVDREMWEKIILNLLSNALKFTFAGAIAVDVRRDGHHVLVTIRDTGIGIPADELPNLFKRFHRVRGAQARTHEGSGIGLALVKQLVKLMSGTIVVTSTMGAGTTFTIRFPLGRAHLRDDQIKTAPTIGGAMTGARTFVDEALGWLNDGESAGGGSAGSALPEVASAPAAGGVLATQNARVLLADDNADMREYLRRLLEPRWRVRAVADGETALAALADFAPELVLADVMMPKLDGFELLAQIRAQKSTCELPVILLSARAGEEAVVEGLRAGADDYLVKPFSAREVIARVDAHIRLKRLREAAGAAQRASEARFQAICEAAPLVIFEASADGRAIYTSPEWERITGQSSADSAEDGWIKPIHPEDRDRVLCKWHNAIKHRQSFDFEFRVFNPHGETRWLRGLARPILSDSATSSYVGFAEDFTENRSADDTLRGQKEQYETLFNESPDGIYLIDGDLRFRQMNALARKVFDIADINGRSVDEVMHILWPPDIAEFVTQQFRRTLATGEPYTNAEFVSPRANRAATEAYQWQLRRTPLPDGGYGVICYFRDISAQLEAQRAIEESEERFRTLAESIPQLAWMATPDGWIFWYNQRWYEFTGTTLDQMEGWAGATRIIRTISITWYRVIPIQ